MKLYLKTYFNNDTAHQEFLNTLKERSIYEFTKEELTTDDKILTLSTCTDASNDQRTIVFAKESR